jgi:imidazole glycerol-phosphate synthase subunit HisF
MKIRLSGFVTIKDDWAVQSFGFKNYLPIGKPEIVVENLSRWGADEIFVNCIDSSKKSNGPNVNILKKIYKRNINTPIIYSGGIRNLIDAKKIINEGADRIAINNSAFLKEPDYFQSISGFLGSQALILGCSFIKINKNFFWYDYNKHKLKNIDQVENFFKNHTFSELLLIDVKNEGYNSFNYEVLSKLNSKIPKILFGGVRPDKILSKIKKFNIKALSFGNRLNYKEIKVQEIKKKYRKIFRKND